MVKQAQINVAIALAMGGDEVVWPVPVGFVVVKSMPRKVVDRSFELEYTSYAKRFRYWQRPEAPIPRY